MGNGAAPFTEAQVHSQSLPSITYLCAALTTQSGPGEGDNRSTSATHMVAICPKVLIFPDFFGDTKNASTDLNVETT